MFRVWIILIGLTLLGGLLRFFNLSPFTVYPDSFQNLLVAENLKTYGEVVGYLGKDGLLFPEVFSWSRPLYALLINWVSYFGISSFVAAQYIAYVLGILAIPVAFLFVRSIFKNTKAGLIGAGLLALSYNHTVWSGMIMTESIGVFFLLLFLWRFFASVRTATGYFNFQNVLIGLLFCLAVLARYEYILIILPVIFLTVKLSPKPIKYLSGFFVALILGILVTGFLIFPYQTVIPIILTQHSDELFKVGIFLLLLVIVVLLKIYLPKTYRNKMFELLPKVISIIWIVFILYLFLQIIFGQAMGFLYLDFSFIRQFIKHDILFGVLSFVGILLLLRKEKKIAYFVLLSLVTLGFIYHLVNPDMERYMTHLIPFLLIPASYAVFTLVFTKIYPKKLVIPVLSVLILFQIVLTAYGLRNLNDSSWFQPSYEEVSARTTGRYIKGDPILLVSFPEPYYYFLQIDTQSIADTPPFVYLPSDLNNRTILIVEDMGMHDVFPNFSTFLDKKLGKYKVGSFKVPENYHYENLSIPEKSPVVLYQIKLKDLKKEIN